MAEVNCSSEEGRKQSQRKEEEGTLNAQTVRTRASEGPETFSQQGSKQPKRSTAEAQGGPTLCKNQRRGSRCYNAESLVIVRLVKRRS